MTLSYFHEKEGPHGKIPDLTVPPGGPPKMAIAAAVIKALELHTGMNYHHMEDGGFDACCSCIG
jgi:hypothetical protein